MIPPSSATPSPTPPEPRLLQCPKCRMTLATPVGEVGKLPPFVNCPGCGVALLLPTADKSPASSTPAVELSSDKESKEGRLISKLRIEPTGTRDFIPKEEMEWDESLAFLDRRREEAAPVPVHTKRWPWIGGIVLALGVGYFLGWQTQQITAEPEVTLVPSATSSAAPNSIDVGKAQPVSEEAVQAVQESLRRFVAASPAKKRSYIIDPQRVGPVLEAYYAAGERNDDVLLEEITPLPQVEHDLRRGIFCFFAKSPSGPLLIAMKREVVEEGLPPVFKLDWETYVQEKEGTLKKFVDSHGEDSSLVEGVFRVGLARSHLFDDKDEQLNRIGLRLSTPTGQAFEPRVVVISIDPLYKRLENELGWNRNALATVRLAWEKVDKNAAPTLQIKEFFCWELAGIGGTAESSLPPPAPLPAPTP